MPDTELEELLTKHYGTSRFKTLLAKDLGVSVRTVRRMFNTNASVKKRDREAILGILNKNEKGIPQPPIYLR